MDSPSGLPVVVAAASTLQFLIAASFLLMAGAAWRFGDAAQQAAECAVRRQGCSPEVLLGYGVNFRERLPELLLPIGIAAVFATLGTLNIAGDEAGRVGSWVAQPVILVVGGIAPLVRSSPFVTFRALLECLVIRRWRQSTRGGWWTLLWARSQRDSGSSSLADLRW